MKSVHKAPGRAPPIYSQFISNKLLGIPLESEAPSRGPAGYSLDQGIWGPDGIFVSVANILILIIKDERGVIARIFMVLFCQIPRFCAPVNYGWDANCKVLSVLDSFFVFFCFTLINRSINSNLCNIFAMINFKVKYPSCFLLLIHHLSNLFFTKLTLKELVTRIFSLLITVNFVKVISRSWSLNLN